MAESRLVPSNLTAWPRIRDLVPDYKLIIYHLWATANNDAGCWLIDTAAFSAGISLREPALLDALAEFKRRELIDYDSETGEVFIVDWFRWHKFQTAPRQGLLSAALKKIASDRLRERVENIAKTVTAPANQFPATAKTPCTAFPEKTDTCKPKQNKRNKYIRGFESAGDLALESSNQAFQAAKKKDPTAAQRGAEKFEIREIRAAQAAQAGRA